VRTAGFDVLAWAHRFLPSPSDPLEPLVLSDEQAAFVVDFYSQDTAGAYVYRRGALQAAKGWGKSPLGAVLALAEFAGPTAPATPWVQVAACSEEQAVSNVYQLLWQLLSENDAKAARELGVDLGRGRLYLKGKPGAKLEAVSSSWGAREGQRVTFAVLDETHNWLKQNGGQRLARVLRRNAAKTNSRTLELANAPELAEDSVAEETERHFAEGRPGVLFAARRPSRDPDPAMSDAELRELLAEVYAGAAWVDLDRLVREVRDPAAPWSEVARFFFNAPGSMTQAAVEPALWASRARERVLEPGERIGLGFDGSKSRDATALVGCTQDGWCFPVEILERPAGASAEWRVDRPRISRALAFMMQTYDVRAVFADPWTWQDEISEWGEQWGERIVEIHTNSVRHMPAYVDRFRTALAEGAATHDGDDDLTRHVLAARLRKAGRDEDGRGRWMLEKAGPGRLIDGCVAAVLAYSAAATISSAPDPEPMVTWA
jgi:phage terminase large subunit-like protein